jgi:hypothetical protein
MLQKAYSLIEETWKVRGETIIWKKDDKDVMMSPEYIVDIYAPNVDVVRDNFMSSKKITIPENRLNRYKIIALTERVIVATQPLMVSGVPATSDFHYLLNAEYAIYFGLQYLAKWNHVYSREPFFPDHFFDAFSKTDEGFMFFRDHLTMVCAEILPGISPVPLMWSAQLWFAVEQWGLNYTRLQSTYAARKTMSKM